MMRRKSLEVADRLLGCSSLSREDSFTFFLVISVVLYTDSV